MSMQKKHSKLSSLLGVFGIVHLLTAILNSFWYFKFLSYDAMEVFVLSSVFIAIKAAILLSIVYYMTGQKNLIFICMIGTYGLTG